MKPHVTAFSVNTMTLTARSSLHDIDFFRMFDIHGRDVQKAAEDFEFTANSVEDDAGEGRRSRTPSHRVVFMILRDRGGGVVNAGFVRKANGKIKRYSPNVFENQATLVVRMRSGTHTNIKLFRNGHIQMTGSRSEEEGREAAELVVSMAADSSRSSSPSTIETDENRELEAKSSSVGEPSSAPGAHVGPMNVCLMNSDFRLTGGYVDRQAFYEVATVTFGVQSSFQPAIYPAVKCFFMWRPETADGSNSCLPSPRAGFKGPDRGTCPDKRPTAPGCDGVCPIQAAHGVGGCDGKGCCKRVTILIFHTGAAIVTGGVTQTQIRACHAWVDSVCASHGEYFILPAT